MISLKDLWQQQRLQRQQEIVQRQQDVALHQQQVRNELVQMQQERLIKATELHNSLKQFQADLQQQTQSYLKHISDQRRQQAEILVANLRQFAEALQAQTHQFLSLIHADRQLRAEELFRNLSIFHANLSTSVVDLRNNLQIEIQALRVEVQTICAETQMYLSSRQQERIREHIQLAESLSAYVQDLQAEVRDYMDHLSQLGQERAQEIQQEFQEQRQARALEMQGLFEDLAIFRGELREYCTNLHAMVWGNGSQNGGEAQVTPPFISKPQGSPSSTPEAPNGHQGIRPTAPQSVSPKTQPTVASVTAPVPTTTTAPTPITTTTPVPVSTAVATATLESSTEPPPALATPDTSIDTFADSVNDEVSHGSPTLTMSWGTASVTPSRKEISEVESEIVGYLQSGAGARLMEIESALDINRFQAVDALRSLIKQGRVTQRDRVYVIQEEATL